MQTMKCNPLSILALILFGSLAVQAGEQAAQDWEEALFKGKIHFNLRLRAEIVEQEGVDGAQAYTSRIRLGYGTRPLYGFSGFVEMEDIRAADDDRYNAAGLNDNAEKAAIADPEETELNQFYIKYVWEFVEAIVGRQRIILDDARFVGNVGWRQNEQTYDAGTIKVTPLENLAIFYSYVRDVHRIFGLGSNEEGPASRKDFDSDSHLINVSYAKIPVVGKVVVFAYLLDFDNSAANSSDTYGIRAEGTNPIGDADMGLTLKHMLSYAQQQDSGDNPNNYDAEYYLIDLSLAKKGWGNAGVGYEVLGSDDITDEFGDPATTAFRTPLATLHKFNGWADVFLATPDDGLEDLYFYAGTTFYGVKAVIVKHFFSAENGGEDYGNETDIVLAKSLNKRTKVTGKFAWFDGKDPFADRAKVWIQMDYAF